MRFRGMWVGSGLMAAAFGLLALGTALGQPKAEATPPAEKGSTADQSGLVVVAVDLGSPAEKAGVKRGDILIKADKIELGAASDLTGYVSRLKGGDAITLELRRGDSAQTLSVTLGEHAGRPYLGVSVQGPEDRGGILGRLRAPDSELMPGIVPWRGPGPMLNPYSNDTRVEARIVEVIADSPAAKAGMKSGDAVLSVDGAMLTIGASLAEEVSRRTPGDKVTLEVRHGEGGTEKLEVTLAASADDAKKPYLGVRFQPVPIIVDGRSDRGRIVPFSGDRRGGMVAGLVVREVAPGSPADQAGIKAGDIITSIGGDQVTPMTPIADLVGKHKPGDKVDLALVSRADASQRTVSVTLGSRAEDKERAYLGVTTGGGRMWVSPNDGRSLPRGQVPLTPRSRGRSDI